MECLKIFISKRLRFAVIIICMEMMELTQCDNGFHNNNRESMDGLGLNDPKSILTRTIDQIMIPLYDATNYFLETALAPKSLMALNATYDLAKWNRMGDAFYWDWTTWMDHYLTYVMCMMCAGIYVIFLIVSALCICCCRARGRCGSFDSMDGKNSKCKRRTCGFILFLIILFLLLGTVASIIANQLTWEMTIRNGMNSAFESSLILLEDFQNTTVKQYTLYYQTTNESYSSIQNTLEFLPSEGANYIEELYNVSGTMQQLENSANQLENITEPLENAANITSDIAMLELELEKTLLLLQSNFSADLSFCKETDCIYMIEKSNNISVQTNFSGLPDLSEASITVQNVITGNETIFLHINSSKESYTSLANQINNIMEFDLEMLLNSTDSLYDNFSFLVTYMIQDVLNKYDFNDAMTNLKESIGPDITTKGDIRYICCLIMCIILFILVITCIVALCFGMCGSRKQEHYPSCCHKGKAASALTIVLIMIFISGIIFMSAIILFFILGAITHNDICRPAIDPTAKHDSIQALDYAFSSYINMKQSSAYMLQECATNETIYTSLAISDLGSQYNISEIAYLGNYDINKALYNISIANYSTKVYLISNELGSDLQVLDSAFTSMELNSYEQEISKPITNINLENFAQELEDFGIIYNGTNDTLSDIFLEYAEEFNSLYVKYVEEIQILTETLEKQLHPVTELNNKTNFSGIYDNLENVENDLKLGRSVQFMMSETAGNLTMQFNETTSQAESLLLSGLGHCASVFEAYYTSSSVFCIKFLYPFNAYWLSIGWCLVWFLPLIIVATCLIDQYNKTETYNDLFSKTGRASFHRTRQSGRKSGKSSCQFIDSIDLDHNPGSTDIDDDIDYFPSARLATTTFHGNDAFGYHGRTVNDDALEYFGRSNLKSVTQQRGLRDGTLPPETYGVSTPRGDLTAPQQYHNQQQLTSHRGHEGDAAARAQNRHSNTSNKSTSSGNSKQSNDASSYDEQSLTKTTLEHSSRHNTYPLRQNSQNEHSTSSIASRIRSSGCEPEPMVYTGASKRAGIPLPFLAGVQNPCYVGERANNNEEEVDAENYVQHIRRTSRRMSKGKQKKQQSYAEQSGAIPKTKQYSNYGSQGFNIDSNYDSTGKQQRSYNQPMPLAIRANQLPQEYYSNTNSNGLGISNPSFASSPTYESVTTPPVSPMAFSPAKNFQLPTSNSQRLNYSGIPINQLPHAAVKPSFATASPTENINYQFLSQNKNSFPNSDYTDENRNTKSSSHTSGIVASGDNRESGTSQAPFSYTSQVQPQWASYHDNATNEHQDQTNTTSKEVNYFAHSPLPLRSSTAGVVRPFSYIPAGVKRDHQKSPVTVVKGTDYVRHNSFNSSGNESQEYIHAAYF